MQKNSKKIIINAGIYERRVAIIENNRLEEFYIEQEDSQKQFGNVYKGIVESIVPGIGAAFINIGTGKNGFLYISDIQDNEYFLNEEVEEIISNKSNSKKDIKISEVLKEGQEIVVQVGKESIGTKGPRLTTHVSLPGRFLVLTPFDDNIGVSKKIGSIEERNRIRDILKQLKINPGLGCIVRTAGKGVSVQTFTREFRYLTKLWERIDFRAKRIKAPVLLYQEYGLLLRTIRDLLTEDVEGVIVDSREEYKNILRFLSLFMPNLKSKITFYNEATPVFERYGIESEIEKLFQRKIQLRNGGSIVIEQTEGMVAIDVNTERFKGRKDLEDTVFKTNIEAAREIARQIRLRDMGGIIIIDFIDMITRDHRAKVQETLELSLKRDKAKTKILNMSSIGVVEMTRQRVRRSLESSMYKECPYCHGRGLIKSETTIATQFLRKIEKESRNPAFKEIDVWVHPGIYDYLMANEKNLVVPLKRKCRKPIRFYKDSTMHIEDVRIA